MKKYLIPICTIILLFASNTLKSQCIDVEEFYAFTEGEEFNWDTLFFKTDALNEFKESFSGVDKGVSFMTPLVVNHIRLFHPKCAIRKDMDEFKGIVEIYNYLHEKNYPYDSLHLESTCNNVINDFKRFCREDSSYGKMVIFLFESGPFFGKKTDKLDENFSVNDSLDIGIGKVFALHDMHGDYFAFSSKANTFEWIMETPECEFSQNTFSKFSKNPLGFVVKLGTGDFSTILYLDSKGRFRFYVCELD